MNHIRTLIYQTHQIRDIEQSAHTRFNISGHEMMQRAGKAAMEFMHRRWPMAKKIMVFCGGGNNGGDGYVVARLAHERGLHVIVWQISEVTRQKPDAWQAYEDCRQAGIDIKPFHQMHVLPEADVIVDAMLGIGLKETVRDEIGTAIAAIEKSSVPVFSLDMPTGIDADTGKLCGVAVRAAATMTFIGLKTGLLTGSGIAHAGELVCADLQLPPELLSSVKPVAEKIQLNQFHHYLKPRPRDWHKGQSGHVLIVGGTLGFSGAPRMAAEAALRVGAGLVSVATRPEHAMILNAACPEIMSHAVQTPADLEPLLEKADVIVLGPGLGQSSWAKALWQRVCAVHVPLVVDADGLNLLAEKPLRQDHWVLTPHPGEAARLLKMTAAEVQDDRLSAVTHLQRRYGGVVVLKGAGSLIAAPNGLPAICDKGNPGMATAGMGDVLSGVIGSWLSQGIPLDDAAKLGVCLHAIAGDLAARDGERGMIAMDLMPFLRRLSNIA